MNEVVERVHCSLCEELKTIIDHIDEKTAILDCGHTIYFELGNQTWSN